MLPGGQVRGARRVHGIGSLVTLGRAIRAAVMTTESGSEGEKQRPPWGRGGCLDSCPSLAVTPDQRRGVLFLKRQSSLVTLHNEAIMRWHV